MTNPRLIEGIFNYCDRWCERCPFTRRCLTFAMEQEENRQQGGPPADMDAFWKRFEASMELTREMVESMVAERDGGIDDAEMKQLERVERRRERRARNHPLAKAALAYTDMAEKWFAGNEGLLREREAEILEQARLGLEKVKEEVASLTDIVEIIRWYQHQIYVKLVRALDADRDYEATSGFPKDSDGSAKVAFIGLDRSIAAWVRMKECFPEQTDDILTLLVHLDRLRRGAEAEFPAARAFVRPGFDTGDTPE